MFINYFPRDKRDFRENAIFKYFLRGQNMSHIGVFLNTEIKDSVPLAALGDWGLTPVRYLFNGNTVEIESNSKAIVHHVESFHHKNNHRSCSKRDLKSSKTDMLICIGMIVCLIPGFFLSIFKAFAYFSADMREDHRLAKLHFTPIDRTIGTPTNPISLRVRLKQYLDQEEKKPLHQPTDTLTIHGDGSLPLSYGINIKVLNPKKVILEGVTVNHHTTGSHILGNLKTSKWKLINPTTDRRAPTTLDEARHFTPPRKGWITFDRWQVIIEIPRPGVI